MKEEELDLKGLDYRDGIEDRGSADTIKSLSVLSFEIRRNSAIIA